MIVLQEDPGDFFVVRVLLSVSSENLAYQIAALPGWGVPALVSPLMAGPLLAAVARRRQG